MAVTQWLEVLDDQEFAGPIEERFQSLHDRDVEIEVQDGPFEQRSQLRSEQAELAPAPILAVPEHGYRRQGMAFHFGIDAARVVGEAQHPQVAFEVAAHPAVQAVDVIRGELVAPFHANDPVDRHCLSFPRSSAFTIAQGRSHAEMHVADHGSSLPGLRMPAGSNAALTWRIRASVAGSIACGMNSRLARPMPCSPDRVPPSDSVSANTRARAACARPFWPVSAGSKRMFTCRLPLPAWPKLTMGNANSDARSRTPWTSCGMRETGTTTSSLILPGASVRNAGDNALRAAQSLSRAASSAASSSETRPSPSATRIRASMACGRVWASPSASTISSAPASAGSSAPPTSRASRTQSPSMNSSIDGVTGCAISRATACAAEATSRYSARTTRRCGGSGVSLRVASTISAKVPSLPTSRRCRS